MKKLNQNIQIDIPDHLKSDFDTSTIIYEIYYIDDIEEDYLFWELYGIKLQNSEDMMAHIKISKIAMDYSREIEEEGGGPIEEFIFQLFLNHIYEYIDEKNTKSFIEDISD